MELSQAVGNRIKELRSKNKLTQRDLAKQLNVSASCLSGWEQGTREPGLCELTQLAATLDTTCDYLIRGYHPENLQAGKETGLSNAVVQRLKYWHKERPEYDEFTEFLLGSVEYWQLNLCLSNIVAAENAAQKIPDVEFGYFVNSVTGNMADEVEFRKYKAVQCFSKLIDKYLEEVVR